MQKASACSAKSAVAIVVFALFILAPFSKASGDDEREAEIRKLQGRYERTFKNDAGTEFRTPVRVRCEREPGGNPGLSRSGKQERPPS